MNVIKFIVLLFILSVVISCEDEDGKELIFSGRIKDGDTGLYLGNVKVKLTIDALQSSGFLDSVFTDQAGNYRFVVKYNPSQNGTPRYLIRPAKEFYEFCSTGNVPFVHNNPWRPYDDVDVVNVNVDDFVMCETAHVKLTAKKLEVAKSDTLFFSQEISTPVYNNVYMDGDMFTDAQNERLYKYYAKRMTKTTFKFRIKEAEGTVSYVDKEVDLKPSDVVMVTMDF